MSDILKLSVSKCKTFNDCKAKYKFQYIDNLPKKTWDFFIFGSFCHKVLEDFHNAYIIGTIEPYNKIMSKSFKTALELFKKDMTPELKVECREIIDQYLRIIYQNKLANIMACEKNFEISLDKQGKIILNGMIDRIQIDDDNVCHVADYKTTKNKKYLKDDNFQLMTYAYTIFLTDPTFEKIRGSYILLRHKFEHITTEFSLEEASKIKDIYLDYADKILSEKNFEANPTNLCRFCNFTDYCQDCKKILNPSTIYGEVDW